MAKKKLTRIDGDYLRKNLDNYMSWQYTFVPNPSDENIPVLENPPAGFEISNDRNYKTARIPFDQMMESNDTRDFYYCLHCNGWIEGIPFEHHEDDIGPLCGRRGIVSSCIRCGNEIGFSGMVS